MAIIEMKVPSPGESITEVQIARWLKKDGDFVEKDEKIRQEEEKNYASGIPSVAAEKLMKERGIPASKISATGKGGRITKGDVLHTTMLPSADDGSSNLFNGERNERREKMTMLRKRV